MKLPDEIREFFRKKGAIGGKKRASNMSPEDLKESARNAARARWAKKGAVSKKSFKKSKREV